MSEEFNTKLHTEQIKSPCETHKNLDIVCCPVCLQHEYDLCRVANVELAEQYQDILVRLKKIYDEVGNMNVDDYIAPLCAVLDVIEKHIPELKESKNDIK